MSLENDQAVSIRDWYYAKDDIRSGPISLDEIRSAVATSEITEDTLVWKRGTLEWMPAKNVPELVADFDIPPPLPSQAHSSKVSITLAPDKENETPSVQSLQQEPGLLKRKTRSFLRAALKGRVNRLNFLLLTVVSFPILFTLSALLQSSGHDPDGLFSIVISALWILYYSSRRFNDTGRGGGWSGLLLIPFVNALVFLVLLFDAGDKHENEYGPVPL